MTIRASRLRRIHPPVAPVLAAFAPALAQAMQRYRIDSPRRQAAFIAQFAYELGRLEIRDGEERQDIRRGLLQITRQMPRRLLDGLRGGIAERPRGWFAQVEWVAMSAAWWWSLRGMNRLADAGNFEQITLRISGGERDLEQRLDIWRCAERVFTTA